MSKTVRIFHALVWAEDHSVDGFGRPVVHRVNETHVNRQRQP